MADIPFPRYNIEKRERRASNMGFSTTTNKRLREYNAIRIVANEDVTVQGVYFDAGDSKESLFNEIKSQTSDLYLQF